MKRNTILSLLAITASINGFAQGNFMTLEYPIAFPTGNLQDYIEKTCWRGLGFGYRYLTNDHVAVGIDMSWNTFYERKDKATYTFESTSITGVQYRYTNAFNISGQLDYVWGYGNDVRPFLGVGAGTMYVNRVTDFGIYRYTQDPWQFMIEPELGFSYYMSNGTGLIISANYYSGFDTKELEGQSFISLNVGMIWATD